MVELPTGQLLTGGVWNPELQKFWDKRVRLEELEVPKTQIIREEDIRKLSLTANISADSFSASKNYERVIIEQGVPVTDRDLNETGEIAAWRFEQLIANIIGTGAIGNGFLVAGTGANNDFAIDAGMMFVADSPNGGTTPAGYLLDNSGFTYAGQQWSNQGVAQTPAALTTPTGARTDTVWLEVWAQDYGPSDDSSLYWANPLTSSNTDISHRLKIMAVVRVWENSGAYVSSLNITTAPFYTAGHTYYPIAQLARTATAAINAGMVTDLRPIIQRSIVLSGQTSITATATTAIVSIPLLKSTSRIYIQRDSSLGGATWGAINAEITSRTTTGAGQFVVTSSSAAPAGGLFFSWEVIL